jgi:hypothetical protein
MSLGGDGSTRNSVSTSCAVSFRLTNVLSAKAYIDVDLNATRAIQVQCVNGTSLGGDGSSVEASSVSCAALWAHWGLANGTFYVYGSLTFVIFLL